YRRSQHVLDALRVGLCRQALGDVRWDLLELVPVLPIDLELLLAHGGGAHELADALEVVELGGPRLEFLLAGACRQVTAVLSRFLRLLARGQLRLFFELELLVAGGPGLNTRPRRLRPLTSVFARIQRPT